jgi:hypothetical protein
MNPHKIVNSELNIALKWMAVDENIKLINLEKVPHPKFFVFRANFETPQISPEFRYLTESDRDSDMRLLSVILGSKIKRNDDKVF